jgi:hypothetical protein
VSSVVRCVELTSWVVTTIFTASRLRSWRRMDLLAFRTSSGSPHGSRQAGAVPDRDPRSGYSRKFPRCRIRRPVSLEDREEENTSSRWNPIGRIEVEATDPNSSL